MKKNNDSNNLDVSSLFKKILIYFFLILLLSPLVFITLSAFVIGTEKFGKIFYETMALVAPPNILVLGSVFIFLTLKIKKGLNLVVEGDVSQNSLILFEKNIRKYSWSGFYILFLANITGPITVVILGYSRKIIDTGVQAGFIIYMGIIFGLILGGIFRYKLVSMLFSIKKYCSFRGDNVGFKIGIPVAISIILLITVSIIVMVQWEGLKIKKDTKYKMNLTAETISLKVIDLVESPLNEVRAIAEILQPVAGFDNTSLKRSDLNKSLKSLIEDRKEYLGVYVGFEPDAFDGLDEAYSNKKGHDSKGRFVPYWTRNSKGKGVIEPLVDYDKPGGGDYYQIPK